MSSAAPTHLRVFPPSLSLSESLPSQLSSLLQEHLSKNSVLDHFELFELNLINQFNLNSYELCHRVGLDQEQTCVMVNILFEVLANGNPSYGEGNGRDKTKEKDWDLLRRRVGENPCVTGEQLRKLLKEFSDFYFRNFLVFNYALNNPERPPREKVTVIIDEPSYCPPLS